MGLTDVQQAAPKSEVESVDDDPTMDHQTRNYSTTGSLILKRVIFDMTKPTLFRNR